MRNDVPPWMSRPSAMFFWGGQIVAMLKTNEHQHERGGK